MQHVRKELGAAYADLGRWIGILLGATSLFSWLSRAWDFSLSQLMAQVVGAYQSVFHPIIDFLFAWSSWAPPPSIKDLIVLYAVLGGTVLRTYWKFYSSKKGAEGRTYGPAYFGMSSTAVGRLAALFFSFVAWPVALFFALRDAFVFRAQDGRLVAFSEHNEPMIRTLGHEYVCSLRWMFALQLVAMIAVCALIVGANVLTLP